MLGVASAELAVWFTHCCCELVLLVMPIEAPEGVGPCQGSQYVSMVHHRATETPHSTLCHQAVDV